MVRVAVALGFSGAQSAGTWQPTNPGPAWVSPAGGVRCGQSLQTRQELGSLSAISPRCWAPSTEPCAGAEIRAASLGAGAARWRLFLIERDTDPTRLSPDNATMMIAVLCIDNQVE